MLKRLSLNILQMSEKPKERPVSDNNQCKTKQKTYNSNPTGTSCTGAMPHPTLSTNCAGSRMTTQQSAVLQTSSCHCNTNVTGKDN